jgi:hypothetical protein
MTYSCACNQLSRNGDRTGSRRGFVFVAAFVIRLFKADRVVGEKERRREKH